MTKGLRVEPLLQTCGCGNNFLVTGPRIPELCPVCRWIRRGELGAINQRKRLKNGRVRATMLLRKFGLTEADYEKMVEEQDGRCFLCHRKPDVLHIDHNHKTGRVRKLLCFDCNTGLGKFGDDPVRLREAATYLE